MALTSTQLSDYFNSHIKKNGRQQITGGVMSYALHALKDYIDAIPSSNIGSSDLLISSVVRKLKMSGGTTDHVWGVFSTTGSLAYLKVIGNGDVEVNYRLVVGGSYKASASGMHSFTMGGGLVTDGFSWKNSSGVEKMRLAATGAVTHRGSVLINNTDIDGYSNRLQVNNSDGLPGFSVGWDGSAQGRSFQSPLIRVGSGTYIWEFVDYSNRLVVSNPTGGGVIYFDMHSNQITMPGLRVASSYGAMPAGAVAYFESTTGGLVPPRLSATEITAMGVAMLTSTTLYNITTNKLQCWDGTNWNDLF